MLRVKYTEADIDVIANGTYKSYSSPEELASSSIFQTMNILL